MNVPGMQSTQVTSPASLHEVAAYCPALHSRHCVQTASAVAVQLLDMDRPAPHVARQGTHVVLPVMFLNDPDWHRVHTRSDVAVGRAVSCSPTPHTDTAPHRGTSVDALLHVPLRNSVGPHDDALLHRAHVTSVTVVQGDEMYSPDTQEEHGEQVRESIVTANVPAVHDEHRRSLVGVGTEAT